MALTDGDGMNTTMLVGPTAYPMQGGNGFGNGFGNDWGWIILLLLFADGGWGNGFGGGFGGGFANYEFPWLFNGQQGINNNVSDGFRDAQLHDSVTSVRDGISALSTQLCGCCGDIQNSLCNGFNGVTSAVNGAQNALAQQMYTNQIADLERSYAAQTAQTAGMNNLAMGLQNCCCENRAATADLKYTVATEACADRAAISDALKDVITNQTASTQRILDQLCQDKIDAKNDEIAQLRQQLNMADLRASQTAQNAFISQGFTNEVDALYNRLNSCPVPTTPVYGRTPIFTCNNNSCGCNCGCGMG
jgi:hypothetical protein